ncbi:6,7-dimethyl-8-ribityllumazine synthase, partial [Candidatus Peregrinibacteria bacterium]|nr:6,7-dimethyl-8-ribityllumazine synthase [Candidatus Peregrinibacteria bacterium]
LKGTKSPEISIKGKSLKIAIILPYFNEELGSELLKNIKEELLKNKVGKNNIKIHRVSGALELPFAAMKISENGKTDCIIALGIIIKGDTDHYDYVCKTTYNGLMQVQLIKKVPIIFGILTCANVKQAKVRVTKSGLNKGKEIAIAALLQTQIT